MDCSFKMDWTWLKGGNLTSIFWKIIKHEKHKPHLNYKQHVASKPDVRPPLIGSTGIKSLTPSVRILNGILTSTYLRKGSDPTPSEQYIEWDITNRSKFRSQTSDNIEWEESEKRRRAEERRWERKSEKRQDAGVQKGRKVAKDCVFVQWFVALERRKVGSLKRRVRSHLARWVSTSCTPLWRKTHLEVKMYKTHHVRTTFGSWDVEKVHTFFWREAHFEVKMYKTHKV